MHLIKVGKHVFNAEHVIHIHLGAQEFNPVKDPGGCKECGNIKLPYPTEEAVVVELIGERRLTFFGEDAEYARKRLTRLVEESLLPGY